MVVPLQPTFFLGITGNMDLRPGVETAAIRERIRQFLRFLKSRGDERTDLLNQLAATAQPDVNTADVLEAMRAWPTLAGIPVVLLSSLAPGADSIAAEVTLELRDAERAKANGSADAWDVIPVLPFPPEVYVRSRTFKSDDPEQSARDAENVARFRDLLARCEAESDPVVVRTADDAGLSETELSQRFEDDLTAKLDETSPGPFAEGDSRESVRFYAAGEYVAACSHLLVAIWDDGAESLGKGGTADVVRARLHGPRFDVLLPTNGIVTPHGGPLLHIYAHRISAAAPAARPPASWRWLGSPDPLGVGLSHVDGFA